MQPTPKAASEGHERMLRLVPALAALVWLTTVGCAAAGNGDQPPGDGEATRTARSTESAARAGPQPPLDRAWVIFGTDTLVVEVARTADERAEGLMYRDEVPDGTGMLFIMDELRVHSFWMANTYVALDIAYMDASYRIVDIVAMEPLVTDGYPSAAPALFALEVRQGWFAEHGIVAGDVPAVIYGVHTGR